MKNIIFNPSTLLALILFSTIYACSAFDDRPEQAKQKLEKRITEESQGAIKLLSFEKTDGIERDMVEFKDYMMDFKGVVEIQRDCYKYYISFSERLFDNFQVNPEKVNDPMVNFFGVEEVAFKKGERLEISGRAAFINRGNGWETGVVKVTEAGRK